MFFYKRALDLNLPYYHVVKINALEATPLLNKVAYQWYAVGRCYLKRRKHAISKLRKDAERYKEEMSGYTPSPDYLQKLELATAAAKKPRISFAETTEPLSARQQFVDAHRGRVAAEIGLDVSAGQLDLELDRRWNWLGRRERLIYEKQAAEASANYRKAMANYAEPSSILTLDGIDVRERQETSDVTMTSNSHEADPRFVSLRDYLLSQRQALLESEGLATGVPETGTGDATSSVVDPGCLFRIRFFSFRIPDPNFFHPGSASKNLNILTQKIVSKLPKI
jgi:hypothetical protein